MELFKLLGTIAVENTEAVKALKETSEEGGKTESKLAGAFSKIGSAAVALGTAVAAGAVAGATALAALTKSAVDAYADYEQLVGGVETLFGAGGQSISDYAKSVGKTVGEVKDEYNSLMKAQQTVLDNADKAYQTAGMSANEYMETVTSFSAALISSLDGDTKAAADKANQAIVDMSDNANKMGSSMESIQNAYQGFAKQNYTMLDNLKLGYGGTKEEMARLLEDAEKISGVKYDLSSYGDVVDAIHVIQTEMGITGTTAKEASETIAGSSSAMKASWKNLVTGFGNENANLTELVGQFTESVVTYGKNLIPRIGIILKSIGTVIAQEVPKLIQKIPSMISDILPRLTESFNSIFKTALGGVFSNDFLSQMEWDFGTAFPNLTKHLKDSAIENFSGSLTRIGEAFEKLSGIVQPFVETVLEMLIYNIQTIMVFISDVAVPALGFLYDAFMDIVEVVLDAVSPAFENIRTGIENLYSIVMEAINDFIIPTFEQFIDIVKQLWEENQDKIEKIGVLFETVFNKISETVQWFVGIVELYLYPMFIWLVQFVQNNMDQVKNIFQSAFDIIGGIIDFFIALFTGNWQGMCDAVLSILESAWELLKNSFNLVKDFIAEVLNAIWSKMVEIWENIKLTISEKIESIKTTVEAKFNAVKDKITEKINAAKDAVKNAIDAIKGFFDFDFKWPDLKMPHFKISPSGWKIGDLLKGEIPSLGIEWYAKGGVLEEPTAFGINGNRLMVGGEAGPEAVAPIDVLQQYISEAVAAQNKDLVDVLQKILSAILSNNKQMKDKFIEALEEMRFDINNREFARLVKAVR